jgi:NAD(P)-dependent dehydrogenase (short-subunit alcohol dehydrogenase family)
MAKQYWNNKVVLITGGSSGIGLAAAKQLAAAGSHVWLAARRLELLEPALKEVQTARRDSSQVCGIVSADVSDSQQARRIVETVTKSVGVPDVLINSAGISQPGYVQDLSPEVFERLMQVNYLGTVYVTGAALPGMMKRGSGHVINLSSAEKGRYMILPGTDAVLFYLLTSKLPKSLVFTIMDLMADPSKKVKKA